MPYLGHMYTHKGMTNNKLHISILNIFHNFGKDTNCLRQYIENKKLNDVTNVLNFEHYYNKQ